MRLLTPILLLAPLPYAFCSPTLSTRQIALTTLQLPQCALSCLLNAITSDGCKGETDFACHCANNKLLNSAGDCVNKSCKDDEVGKTRAQVLDACKAAGFATGGGGDDADGDDKSSTSSPKASSTGRSSSSSSKGSSSATRTSSSSSSPSSSATVPSNPGPSNSPPDQTAAPAPAAPTQDGSAVTTSRSPTRSRNPPMPTDTPLALLPTDRQLSAGAKAGISVSVIAFASVCTLTIALYIRRLKRDLRDAQENSIMPDNDTYPFGGASGPNPRRRSWMSSGGRGGRSPPISPLSPNEMSESIDGKLKKKRGHILSVVVESAQEDDTASMCPREPVAGQKEGLVSPLELDGAYTGLHELPTSITPRARSMERTRDRASSLGESSRPNTGKDPKFG